MLLRYIRLFCSKPRKQCLQKKVKAKKPRKSSIIYTSPCLAVEGGKKNETNTAKKRKKSSRKWKSIFSWESVQSNEEEKRPFRGI